MKLLKTDIKELVRKPEADGLFTTELRYTVAEAKGELVYAGPKISPQTWNEILSFFKWSFDDNGGESQVRLFVNPTRRLWKAWAFPQQTSGSLSTKEVNNEESQKQRSELFEHQDEWMGWGTVHHHCGISAFQSGTDEQDEKNVGGLHITIGNLDKPHYSMHARFYHKGDLFEPDMSLFWDIGDVIDSLPEAVKACILPNSADRIAREQMCVPSDVPFPDKWKENIIRFVRESMWPERDGEYKWVLNKRYQRKNGVWVEAPFEHETYYGGSKETEKDEKKTKHRRGPGATDLAPFEVRVEEARELLEDSLIPMGYIDPDLNDIIEFLTDFVTDQENDAVVRLCKSHHLLPDDLLDAMLKRRKELADIIGKDNGGTGTEAGYGDV